MLSIETETATTASLHHSSQLELLKEKELPLRVAHTLADKINKQQLPLSEFSQVSADIPHAFSYVINQIGKMAVGKLTTSHALLARSRGLVDSGPHYYSCASGFLFHLATPRQEHPVKVLILSNYRVLPKRVLENIISQGIVVLTQSDRHYAQLAIDHEQFNELKETTVF